MTLSERVKAKLKDLMAAADINKMVRIVVALVSDPKYSGRVKLKQDITYMDKRGKMRKTKVFIDILRKRKDPEGRQAGIGYRGSASSIKPFFIKRRKNTTSLSIYLGGDKWFDPEWTKKFAHSAEFISVVTDVLVHEFTHHSLRHPDPSISGIMKSMWKLLTGKIVMPAFSVKYYRTPAEFQANMGVLVHAYFAAQKRLQQKLDTLEKLMRYTHLDPNLLDMAHAAYVADPKWRKKSVAFLNSQDVPVT